MSSEPASALGQSMIAGICSVCSACSGLGDLRFALAVLGRHRVLAHEQERLAHVDVRADAFTLEPFFVRQAAALPAISATRSMRGHPTACTVSGCSPIRTMRSAAPGWPGKCTCASLVTAWRMLGRGAGDLPAHRGRNRNVHVGGSDGRRHRLEAIADADDTSGFRSSKMVGNSRRPSPVDLAIVAGVSPSTIIVTRASGAKPSASMMSTTEPKRSSNADAPTTSPAQLRVALHRAHDRLDAAVVGSRADDDADFSHAPRLRTIHSLTPRDS